jgi:hypothetical protein
MKNVSGDDSLLRQGAEKSFWTLPDLGSTAAATYSTFHEWRLGP